MKLMKNLKTIGSSVLSRRNEIKDKAKPYVDKSIAYAKENPSDVLLGIMTLMLMDLESEVDDLEEITAVSASIDLHNFYN